MAERKSSLKNEVFGSLWPLTKAYLDGLKINKKNVKPDQLQVKDTIRTIDTVANIIGLIGIGLMAISGLETIGAVLIGARALYPVSYYIARPIYARKNRSAQVGK